jgi:hypothetical protein
MLDQVRQLVQCLHFLKDPATNSVTDSKIGDASVRVYFVEIFQKTSLRSLGVLQLELLFQSKKFLLDILMVPMELHPEDGLETSLNSLLLFAQWLMVACLSSPR